MVSVYVCVTSNQRDGVYEYVYLRQSNLTWDRMAEEGSAMIQMRPTFVRLLIYL